MSNPNQKYERAVTAIYHTHPPENSDGLLAIFPTREAAAEYLREQKLPEDHFELVSTIWRLKRKP